MTDKTCEERVQESLETTLDDLRRLWELYHEDSEAYDDDLGNFDEHGLGFWYVEPGAYDDQPEGWFCYQLSTGGPGDEFRFFVNPDLSVHQIEYWFLDWFDGASRTLHGSDYELLDEIYQSYFVDSGWALHQYNEATE